MGKTRPKNPKCPKMKPKKSPLAKAINVWTKTKPPQKTPLVSTLSPKNPHGSKLILTNS